MYCIKFNVSLKRLKYPIIVYAVYEVYYKFTKISLM
jgi:hypothetical protein